jgi:hypothetical protein
VWSLRAIALIVVVGLIAAAAARGEDPAERAERYSVDEGSLARRDSGYTLLDPDWLLPPIESLDAAAALTAATGRANQMMRDEAVLPARQAPRAADGPFAYSLSDDLTAQLRYHRTQMFALSPSDAVRADESSGFSTRPDRDVVDLNMSWRLAGSTVGVGYELQSAARGIPGAVANDAGFARFLPGSGQATHSFTLGLTREWGRGAEPPHVLADPAPIDADLDIAAAAGTPTP